MNIKQLKRFLDLCETKSFTKTAGNMFLSQQALSSSMNALEEELGKTLFRRTPKGVVLTEEGIVLKELCEPLVQSFDDMNAELSRRYDNIDERLVMALAPAVLRASGPDLIHRFKVTHPHFKLKVIECLDTVCVENVQNEVVELAFCPYLRDESDTNHIRLGAEKLCAIVSKNSPLAAMEKISIADLANESLVSFNRYHQIYHTILRCSRSRGFEPDVIVDSGESGILLDMVRTYRYVFICMEYLAVDVDRSSFAVIPFTDSDMVWEYGLIYKKGKKLGRGAHIFGEFIDGNLMKQ